MYAIVVHKYVLFECADNFCYYLLGVICYSYSLVDEIIVHLFVC